MNSFMRLLCVTIVATVVIENVVAKKPDFIQTCSMKDPDINKCVLEKAKLALPNIIKGNRKIGAPALNPLKLEEVTIDSGSQLKVILRKLILTGLPNMELRHVSMDFKKQELTIVFFIDRVQILADYDVHGKLLVLPIEGKGPCNITAVNGIYTYVLPYTLTNLKGQTFAIPNDKDHISFTFDRVYFRLDDLFNGDKKLGENINTMMNENWQEVMKELGGAIGQTVSTVAKIIVGVYFKTVPFKELFPDQ